ncbi:very long chain fatty acid elongase AAEL008004 [Rhipicephalus microplus]|uniref:very long chain fatty acid elongase AAEL008004 n=1 Tax=Rhipicephalus microplus TaxID=6941 RepID=UPI003F6CBCDE
MKFTLNPVAISYQIRQMGDPRTRDYPLVTDPLFVLTLLLSYLYFVRVAGPRWMKNREPFRILNIVRAYNIVMVLLAVKFLVEVLPLTYLPGGEYSLWCQGITGRSSDIMLEYYRTGWVYAAARYFDLLDTVFFVLRKKYSQITHLHVIHHTIVVANTWLFTLFAPEGQPALGVCLNTFVHAVMYFYYFLATFGPAVRKYLWWKKHLTTFQIVQFAIIIAHMSVTLFVDCGFPKHLTLLCIAQTLLILGLFVNFYSRTYLYQRPEQTVLRQQSDVDGKTGELIQSRKTE